jgi:hypothetical protein
MRELSHNPVKCTCSKIPTKLKSGLHFCKKHRCYVLNGRKDR